MKLLERNELLAILSDRARGGDIEAARLYLEMIAPPTAKGGDAGEVLPLRPRRPRPRSTTSA